MSSAGQLLSLIRRGRAVTRSELARRTNLSRSTIADRVRTLLAHGLVCQDAGETSTGGRPPTRLALNRDAGFVLAADLRPSGSRLAVSDLDGELRVEESLRLDQPSDARAPLARLLAAAGCEASALWGVGIALPAPPARDATAAEPLPPGWDAASVLPLLSACFDVPVIVDADVNLRALGEHWVHWRDVDHLLYVDAGESIACTIVMQGRVHRGAQGVAGAIGHTRLDDRDAVACCCGNFGCLEAVAGGHALTSSVAAAGLAAAGPADVVRLVREGEPLATRAVRDAGRALGEALSSAVSFLNPEAIVIGGELSGAHEPLLAGVREVASARLLPCVARDLAFGHARLGDRAAVTGAAVQAIEHLLAPENVDRLVAGERPR